MTAKVTYKRGFLNTNTGIAAFEATVRWFDSDIADGEFKLTDCNRTINLDFTYATKKEKKARTQKIDKLILELQNFRKVLFEQTDLHP